MSYLITGAFMAMDIVSGLLKAFKEKSYTSSIMREGLYHKCGFILCILLGYMVEYAQVYFDLGVTIPVASAVCTYIILNECGSIIENIGAINPAIIPEKIKTYFGKLSE